MSESVIIGVDHGYAAMKTAHFSFHTGLVAHEHEPYTLNNVLEYGGKYYVVGSGRQPLQKDKTQTEDYYLLTLAAIAKELEYRNAGTVADVHLATGLPLTSFGRDKKAFRDYLCRDGKPVSFRFEGLDYTITISKVSLYPQGYAAVLTQSGLLNEPSVIVADIGGWTVDLMRLDILFKALQVNESRASRWCQKVREPMLKQARRLSSDETRDLTQLENIWYEGDNGSADHYNWTRYYALNLHSVFYRGTVEWRCFNSTLHAGKVAAYVNLCLAISAQAIAQRSTVMRKTHSDNELFTFRVWLVRLGLNGDEFKNTRNHLLANLEGDRAYRYDKDTYEANKKKKKSRERER